MTELVIEDVTKPGIKHLSNNLSSYHNSALKMNDNSPSVPISKQNRKTSEPTFWSTLSNFVPSSVLDLLKPSEDIRTEQNFKSIDNTQLVCRVHPFSNTAEHRGCCDDAHDEENHPFNLFVNKVALQRDSQRPKNTFIPHLLQEQNSVAVCRLEVVVTNSKQQKGKNNENSEETESEQVVSVIVRLYKINDSCKVFDKRTNISCVYVPLFLRKLLDLRVGSKVKLTAYNPPINILLTDIKLFPSRNLVSTRNNMS